MRSADLSATVAAVPEWAVLAGFHETSNMALGSKGVKDDVESTSDGQVAAKVYAFQRPRFPVVYAVGRALLAATSPAALRRHLRRMDPPGRRT